MTAIVITGSTRGIGYGLADSFLSYECDVMISGRTAPNVEKAVESLAERHGNQHIFGQRCDVTDPQQVQQLWDAAQSKFGKIDIWINNAGIAHPQMPFWELTPDQIEAVVSTNMIGTMLGSMVALRGMLQQGHGSLYNMEGLGSTGTRVKGLGLYASTKAGLRYLDQSLLQDTEGTPVIVGAIRPGMVMTGMLSGQYVNHPEQWERNKRIFNILADRVETVTPWLAKRILENKRTGAVISWTRGGKLFFRFLTAPFHKRRVVD
jgi:NAD(P)-dependent dehydrogenase (short-subunit alcohol dehydrogenase family)